MRGSLLKNGQGGEKYFRWHGTEITRVENLSDAVFGVAVTLLVVSSQVPTTFIELQELLRLFVPFAVCAIIFGIIWHAHYTFFRRYGLSDITTMLINAVLLFVVIFYLYPLKFLATSMFNVLTDRPDLVGLLEDEGALLLRVYSAGYGAVFLLLSAFYARALMLRHELELSDRELIITCRTLAMLLVHVVVAGLVLVCGLFTSLSGWIYFLIAPMSALIGITYGRKMKALEKPDYASAPVVGEAT